MGVHPVIDDAAVVAMPDKILVERTCTHVIPRPGTKPTVEEVVSFLKGKGASVLQLPERLELIDGLRMTKASKVDKKSLRENIKKKIEQKGTI